MGVRTQLSQLSNFFQNSVRYLFNWIGSIWTFNAVFMKCVCPERAVFTMGCCFYTISPLDTCYVKTVFSRRIQCRRKKRRNKCKLWNFHHLEVIWDFKFSYHLLALRCAVEKDVFLLLSFGFTFRKPAIFITTNRQFCLSSKNHIIFFG